MSEPMSDYVGVDLETTGLNPKLDKIIEIGAVKVKDGQIEGCFQTFVHPGRKIPLKVTELTGIKDEDVRHAPVIGDVLPLFLEFAGELPLVGHSVLFDYSFLKRAAVNLGFAFERTGVDTLKISRKFLPQLADRRLSSLCDYYGIGINAHRALEDAGAACMLYQRLCAQFYNEEDFKPVPLLYKAKKEGPASRAQKERLEQLFTRYGIEPDVETGLLTKNEASRLIDRILASHAALQK